MRQTLWLAALLCGIVGLAALTGCSSRPAEKPPLARAAKENPPAAVAAFVGSKSCRTCHEHFYELWAGSHHGLAMQPFTAELAKQIPPQTADIEVGKDRYRAEIAGGEGFVREQGADGEKKYPIVHVLGGKNVYYFLTPLERGRLQVLPVAFDLRKKQWYDTAASGVRHFVGIREQAVHWRDREYTFNTSCFGCHVSQLSTNYDLATDTYHTVWGEPGINCETCHGPAGEHVRLAERSGGDMPEDVKLFRLGAAASVEQNNAGCASCHAKMYAITTDFPPGDRYFDHFGLVTLEHPDFYPDGRDLGENYTYTSWRMSPCAKSGKLSCVHCHTSSGRLRFKEEETNQSCLPCHASVVKDAAAHSHHKADGPGSRCIACHMPMTPFAAMNRSDHSMLPPTPATTLAYKSPNACNLCHNDHDAAWADDWVRKWYARDYQKPVLDRARLVAAARKPDWSRLAEILDYLARKDRDEIFANSLVRLLAGCEDDRKWPAIFRALEDPSPLVRASAAETLSGHLTSAAVEGLLKATGDEYRLVRIRAASALASLPGETVPADARQKLAKATAELLASMQSRPDDALAHANLGNYYANRGDTRQAIAEFETSLRLMPQNAPALVNASLAYNAAGQNGKAEDCLRRAIKLEPESAPAHFNLGLLLAEERRLDEAEQSLRAAIKVDPKLAAAAYNLAVILAEKRPEEAIAFCRKAAEARPQEPRYAYTLAFYLAKQGDPNEAAKVLQDLLKQHPGYADGYILLGEIYEKAGQRDAARAVYRDAAANPSMPEPQRAQFRWKLQMP